MTEPKKCVVCGKRLPNDDTYIDEFCDLCRDNPKRQEFLKNVKDATREIRARDTKGTMDLSL